MITVSAFKWVPDFAKGYVRDLRVRWALEEAGLPYRTRLLETGSAPFKCRAGSRYLYVDEQGHVHWCSQTRSHGGIPLAEYGPEHLARAFDTVKPCASSCTLGCARTQSAYDEWRDQPNSFDGPKRLPLVTSP